MTIALHPDRDTQITIIDYLTEFGNDPLEEHHQARCLFCKQRLPARAVGSIKRKAHFWHKRLGEFCPAKDLTKKPYRHLTPTNPDPAAAKRMRKVFREDWEKHYSQVRTFIPGLSAQEFCNLIKRANRQRIWEYADLEAWQLPYIFTTLMDFTPANSFPVNGKPFRTYYFRCFFDSTALCYDDLWINRQNLPELWRVSFKLTGRERTPKQENMVKAKAFQLSPDWLNGELKYPPKNAVVKNVSACLDKHLPHNPD